MNKKLIIYGASGHGIVAADIAELVGYECIEFYDDDHTKESLGPYKVISSLPEERDYDLFIAIGCNRTRELISARFDNIVSLIHPNAVVADSASIGKGCIVMANAVINPCAAIGEGTIINTCSSVDHNDEIGKFNHISVGAHLAGTVKTGDRVFIGAGSTVINNICICEDVTVGAGAAIIHDISEKGTYVGVPARKHENTDLGKQ